MRELALAAVLLLFPMSYAHAQVPAIEREALIALYNSTDGDNWWENIGWLGPVGTECTWWRVTCFGGHVQQLDLGYNQLNGAIPPELGNLSSLYDRNGLDLRWNALHSDDPTLIAFQHQTGRR